MSGSCESSPVTPSMPPLENVETKVHPKHTLTESHWQSMAELLFNILSTSKWSCFKGPAHSTGKAEEGIQHLRVITVITCHHPVEPWQSNHIHGAGAAQGYHGKLKSCGRQRVFWELFPWSTGASTPSWNPMGSRWLSRTWKQTWFVTTHGMGSHLNTVLGKKIEDDTWTAWCRRILDILIWEMLRS